MLFKKLLFLLENKETVGLFTGRFQPLTKAHTDIINTLSKENKKGIIFLVKASKKDEEKNPFDEEIQRKLLEEIIPDNIEIVTLKSGFFVDYINELEENNFVLYSGTDRIKSYERFKSYLADGKSLLIEEIKRGDDDISATKVRAALKTDDYDTFKKLTDSRIHKYYNELKEYLKD